MSANSIFSSGRECFCGNQLEGSQIVLPEQCNVPCAGNSAQICGAGDRLNVYEYGSLATTSSTSQTTAVPVRNFSVFLRKG